MTFVYRDMLHYIHNPASVYIFIFVNAKTIIVKYVKYICFKIKLNFEEIKCLLHNNKSETSHYPTTIRM
jgi:hypothetical protein